MSYTPDLEARLYQLERRLAQLERRHAQTIGFARSTADVDDSDAVQKVRSQIDPLSVRDGMPVLFHYGFSSAMPHGSDQVVLFGNGNRSSAVVIASGHQTYRPRALSPGQSILYDMWGHTITLTETGAVIQTPTLILGDLHVTGEIIAGFDSGDQVGLQTHSHPANNTPPTADT